MGGLEALSCVPNRGGRTSTAKREIVRGKKKVERLVGLLHLADSLSVSGNSDRQIAQPNHSYYVKNTLEMTGVGGMLMKTLKAFML